jgi:monoamine oxidase
MSIPLNPTTNPTNEQRYEMLRDSLAREGRAEDYENIINLLGPPPDITDYAAQGELKGVRVGIIGGGLAGMAAAYELRKTGADITVFEASENRIGGRVYTYYFDPDKKYYGEFGPMRIPVSHETTWYYINQLNLDTVSMSSPIRNNFLYVHNTRLRTTDSITDLLYPKYNLEQWERSTPWPELDQYVTTYILNQLTPEQRAELITIQPTYAEEIARIMNTSIREALESLGLSQEAISLVSGVDPSIGSILETAYDEFIKEEYTMDYRNLYRIKGGMVNLPLAFYQTFTTPDPSLYYNEPDYFLGNVEYKFGNFVEGIYQDVNSNRVHLKSRVQQDGESRMDVFDFVICTIPFSILRTVDIKPYFSNPKMQSILEFNYINAQKTIFLCNQRFWEANTYYGNILGGISFTDLPIQSIVYPSDHNFCQGESTCSPDEPGVLVGSYSFNQNGTRVGNQKESDRIEFVKREVEEVHGLPGEFLDSIVEQAKTVVWDNKPNFRGAFAYALPGQNQRFSYVMALPEYNNRVFFAGEHTSSKHGWIQGALQTGKSAANNLAYYARQ